MMGLIGDLTKSLAMFVLYVIRKGQFEWHNRGVKVWPTHPDVLFSSDRVFWREYLHTNGKTYRDDVLVGDIVRITKATRSISCLDVGTFRRSSADHEERLHRDPPWSFLEQYVSLTDLVRALWWTALLLAGDDRMEREVRLHGVDGCSRSTFQHAITHLTAQRILDSIQPRSVFLVAEYIYIHRALSQLARQRGIPVLALQHGIFSESAAGYIFPSNTGAMLHDRLPDHMLVWSTLFRDRLLNSSCGFREDGVVVVGSPRYDVFARAEALYDRISTLEAYGVTGRGPVVLWTTALHDLSTNEQDIRSALRAMADCVAQIEGLTLIIKQHPGEPTHYDRLIRMTMDLPQDHIILAPKTADTSALIHACDLMVVRNSTTVVEAVLLDRPVITMDFGFEEDACSEYARTGATTDVREPGQLLSVMQRLLRDDSEQAAHRGDFVAAYCYRNDGLATQRVADYVEGIVRQTAGGEDDQK